MVISAAGVFSFELLRCLPSNPPRRDALLGARLPPYEPSSSGFSNGGSSGARIWRACARLTLSAAVSPSACAGETRGRRGGRRGGSGRGPDRAKNEHGDDGDPNCYSLRGGGFMGICGVVKGARTHILEHLRVLQQSRQRRRDHVRGRHRVPAGRSLTHLRAGQLCENDWAWMEHTSCGQTIFEKWCPTEFF